MIASAPILLKQWRTAAAVLVVCLVAYAGVTLPSMKSPFIGIVVPALVAVVAATAAVLLLSKLPKPAAAVLAALLLVYATVTWRPVTLRLWNFSAPVSQVKHFQRIFDRTVEAVGSIPDLQHKHLYFPVISQYLNPENLEFGLLSRGYGAPGSVAKIYFEPSIEAQRAELAKAGVVVVFSDDSTLPLPWPASVTIRKEINAAVAESGAFEAVARVPGGPYGGEVIVLKRR